MSERPDSDFTLSEEECVLLIMMAMECDRERAVELLDEFYEEWPDGWREFWKQ